jgi:hypothetical protein
VHGSTVNVPLRAQDFYDVTVEKQGEARITYHLIEFESDIKHRIRDHDNTKLHKNIEKRKLEAARKMIVFSARYLYRGINSEQSSQSNYSICNSS